MGQSTVDGVVAEADIRRTARNVTVYRTLRFTQADGSSRTIKNAVAKAPVSDFLNEGSKGRFYLFSGFDLKGVHGVRTADGTQVHAFPGTNRTIFAIVVVFNILWVALRVTMEGDVPFLGVGLIILGSVGFVLLGKTERESRAHFENDR